MLQSKKTVVMKVFRLYFISLKPRVFLEGGLSLKSFYKSYVD